MLSEISSSFQSLKHRNTVQTGVVVVCAEEKYGHRRIDQMNLVVAQQTPREWFKQTITKTSLQGNLEDDLILLRNKKVHSKRLAFPVLISERMSSYKHFGLYRRCCSAPHIAIKPQSHSGGVQLCGKCFSHA